MMGFWTAKKKNGDKEVNTRVLWLNPNPAVFNFNFYRAWKVSSFLQFSFLFFVLFFPFLYKEKDMRGIIIGPWDISAMIIPLG